MKMIHSRDECSWQWELCCLPLLNVSSAFMINHAPYRFKGSTVETANKRILHHSRMLENNDKVTCTALWNSKNPNEIKKDSELEDAPNGNENDFLKRFYAPASTTLDFSFPMWSQLRFLPHPFKYSGSFAIKPRFHPG